MASSSSLGPPELKKNHILTTKISITNHHFSAQKTEYTATIRMESHVVRRRINIISSHFTAGILTQDVTAPNPHLFPLNCSSNLSTSFRRLDSRMHYGRQASSSQGRFMRPAINSTQQENQVDRPGVCSAKCGKEAKPTTLEAPLYSRPGSGEPLFSRPVPEESYCFDMDNTNSCIEQDTILPASECQRSAKLQEKQVNCTRPAFTSQINGRRWSPRINVLESKRNHVITVELPGVDINDIRVEIDDKNLIARGKRSMKWWKASGCSSDSFTTYHRREISQGPFQVIWPFPPGSDKNSVSAELIEGILHITIPKL